MLRDYEPPKESGLYKIHEDRSATIWVQRQVLAKYLLGIFHLLKILYPFPYIKQLQRVGVTRDSGYWSVVVEFSFLEAGEVTWVSQTS